MRLALPLLCIPAALGLMQIQGCSGESQESLVTWMQHEREIIKPNVVPIPEPT
jgi:Tfp pilus assembly protein PilP